jgi:hypothetical protein
MVLRATWLLSLLATCCDAPPAATPVAQRLAEATRAASAASDAGVDGPPAHVPDASPPRLMRFEVTAHEYRRCVTARRCPKVRGLGADALPATRATRDEAAAYCAFAGSRLPDDREWLAAAQTDGSPFPWGSAPDVGASNCIATEAGHSLRPPGTSPRDVVRGVYDLHGNAMEWTAEGFVRGARFCIESIDVRQEPPASGRDAYIGFRCLEPPGAEGGPIPEEPR